MDDFGIKQLTKTGRYQYQPKTHDGLGVALIFAIGFLLVLA